MDLADVGVFVEAARMGSLAAAARRLGIASMAASRRLAALEQEVGARLVHRTTRALSLTAEGEAFLPHAQAMLEGEAAARASIRPSSAGASGMLRVTASAPFGRKMVAPMIPAFMRANPDLQVDLQVTDAITDIVASGIDVAIRIAVLRDNSLIARRLDANPRKLYASPGYLAEHGAPKILADLADHQCLAITGVSHWTFMIGDKPVQQRVAGRFTASGIETLHMACLGGPGSGHAVGLEHPRGRRRWPAGRGPAGRRGAGVLVDLGRLSQRPPVASQDASVHRRVGAASFRR